MNSDNIVNWTSAIQPIEYLERNTDRMLRIGSTSWRIDGDFKDIFTVGTPNKIDVLFHIDDPKFNRVEYEQLQSTLLWVHSLGFLPQLLSITKNSSLIEILLDEYLLFIKSPDWTDLSGQMTSLDHAIAMRIRTMCMLVAQFKVMDQQVPDALHSILKYDIHWASSESNYAQNNHGMMLAAAVIHASYIFSGFVATEVEHLAEQKLETIVESAFDSNWVCRENTPSYQAFYINFCSDLLNFIHDSKRTSPFLETLEAMVIPAKRTLQIMLLPNGSFPPLGDSGSGRSGFDSVDGTVLSEESGIYIDKNDGIYRSFKCGFSSHVHKHADDTSLTLTIDDDELLLDGGLHSYDWNDKYTLAVKSQRGHSGVFFTRFDDLYPSTLFNPKKPRIDSRMRQVRNGPLSTEIVGDYVVDGTHFVRRTAIFSQGSIGIRDSFESSDPSNDFAVQRFLLPIAANIIRNNGEIVVKSKSSWMTMRFDPLREVVLREGAINPTLQGWISRRWGIIRPCVSIEVLPRTGWTIMDLNIEYGRC